MAWSNKKNIVVPVDLSDFAMAALGTAAELTESPENLHILHVLTELSAADPGVIWGDIDDESRRKHATEAIRKKIAEGNPELAHIDIQIRFGNPAIAIAKYAKEVKSELIVIHSHGRTGASHVLIGSVAERIVRHAHCPVLVIRD